MTNFYSKQSFSQKFYQNLDAFAEQKSEGIWEHDCSQAELFAKVLSKFGCFCRAKVGTLIVT
jgi:hypothetical protein